MPSIGSKISRWWSIRRFRRHCTRVGVGNRGGGPVFIQNKGVIEVGNNFGFRSRRHNMIDIWVGPGARLVIRNHVGINQGTRIACSQAIVIGDRCLIGDECVLMDTDFHPTESGRAPRAAPIVIGPGVWLASRVMVLRGVTIGENSVIAAGAVVTRDIPPGVLAAGVPARVVRPLDRA